MERRHPFTTGDNNKIARNRFKIFLNLLLLKYWANFIIYILVIITSLKCFHCFKLVSQVSDVAHGPLVVCSMQRGGIFSLETPWKSESVDTFEVPFMSKMEH